MKKFAVNVFILSSLLFITTLVLPDQKEAKAQSCVQFFGGNMRMIYTGPGRRYRFRGGNFYMNLSCSRFVQEGLYNLSADTYCVGERIRFRRSGAICSISRIVFTRSQSKASGLKGNNKIYSSVAKAN